MCASEVDYEVLDTDALFSKGKELFKEQKFAESAECFSRCLERLSGDDALDPKLREHYLWFADSLLSKEELQPTLLSAEVESGPDGELPTAESVVKAASENRNEESDENLAFEMFQLGYECYVRYLKEIKEDPPTSEVLDASYCLVRLGDMLITNNQFEAASEEYSKAIKLRQEWKLPISKFPALYIALAQSQMFSGKLKASLETFETARESLKEVIGAESAPNLQDLKDTLEDVEIQISDLNKLIGQVGSEGERGSQSGAASLLPQTTGSLDEKKLEESARKVVVEMGEGKRRRIDLSKEG